MMYPRWFIENNFAKQKDDFLKDQILFSNSIIIYHQRRG